MGWADTYERGGNAVTDGKHRCVITDFSIFYSKKGSQIWKVSYQVADGECIGESVDILSTLERADGSVNGRGISDLVDFTRKINGGQQIPLGDIWDGQGVVQTTRDQIVGLLVDLQVKTNGNFTNGRVLDCHGRAETEGDAHGEGPPQHVDNIDDSSLPF